MYFKKTVVAVLAVFFVSAIGNVAIAQNNNAKNLNVKQTSKLLVQCLDNKLAQTNPKKSLEFCQKATEAGSYLAAYSLGMKYLTPDNGVPIDVDLGLKYIDSAAAHNIAPAIFQQAMFYYDGSFNYEQDYVKARELAKKADSLGNIPEAKMLLSDIYLFGEGVEENDHLAFVYAQKAANSNNPQALISLANMYKYGIGTDVNEKEAFRLVSKASKFDIPEAYFYLGEYYRDGTGVAIDFDKAFENLKIAANKGLSQAEYIVGEEYLINGYLTKLNQDLGYKYMKMAADKNDNEACYVLGSYMLKNKYGDQMEAANYIKKAADLGNPYAQHAIGIMHLAGTLVEKNSDIGIKYLQSAARQGVNESKNVLGKLRVQGYYKK